MNESTTLDTARSPLVATDNPVPVPPFWGVRRLEQVPLKAVLPYINRNTLYKFQWGFKPQGRSVDEYREYAKRELDPILHRLVQDFYLISFHRYEGISFYLCF